MIPGAKPESSINNGYDQGLPTFFEIVFGIILAMALAAGVASITSADAYYREELVEASIQISKQQWDGFGIEANSLDLSEHKRRFLMQKDDVRGIETALAVTLFPSLPPLQATVLDDGTFHEGYLREYEVKEILHKQLQSVRYARLGLGSVFVAFVLVQAFLLINEFQTLHSLATGRSRRWLAIIGFAIAIISLLAFTERNLCHGSITVPLVFFLGGWLLYDVSRGGVVDWVVADVLFFIVALMFWIYDYQTAPILRNTGLVGLVTLKCREMIFLSALLVVDSWFLLRPDHGNEGAFNGKRPCATKR